MDKLLCVLEGAEVRQELGGRVYFKADGDVDADGANGQAGQWAYRTGNSGLEDLKNAGYPNTNWYQDILVCDKHGQPIIYDGGGIASKTAYEWRTQNDPRLRYVDSYSVPYIVVSPAIRNAAKGIVLGCLARVTYKGNTVECVVADIGPLKKVGEISMAAARIVGMNWNPRHGGEEDFIVKYELWTDTPADIDGVLYELQRA